MAERNQDGGGTTTDRVRTSLPEPTPDLRRPARRSVRRRHRRHPGKRVAARARRPCPPARSTRAGRSRATKARRRRARRRRSTCGRCHRSGVGAVATADELALRGRTLSDDRLLADTRESQIAGYLDGWKRRIEQVGTLNFPNEARRRSLSGNPVLEVAISANGHAAAGARAPLERLQRARLRRHEHRAARIALRSVPVGDARQLSRRCVSPTNGSSCVATSAAVRCSPRSPDALVRGAATAGY